MSENDPNYQRYESFEKIVTEVRNALLFGITMYDISARELFDRAKKQLDDDYAFIQRKLHEGQEPEIELPASSEGVLMLSKIVAAHNSGVSAPVVPESESAVVLTPGVKDWVSMLADDAGVDVDLDDLDAAQAANLLRKYEDYKVSLEEEMTANKEFLEDLVELLDDNEGGATASITKH